MSANRFYIWMMSKTQYLSPLGLIGTDIPDRRALQLARKKMLAELELSGETTIMVNGRELSKNDIIVYFEELQAEEDFDLHTAIARDPVLLGFLEHNIIPPDARFLDEPLYQDAAFIDKISPYFCFSFCRLAIACMEEKETHTWNTLFSNPLLMNNWYINKAWDELETYMNGKLELVRHYHSAHDPRAHLDELADLLDSAFVSMIAGLPAERFTPIRDEYAFAMMDVCIQAFNRGLRKWAIEHIQNAIVMAGSGEMKIAVDDKLTEMRNADNERSSSGIWSAANIGRILLVAIFIIFKTVTCNETTSYNNSKYDFEQFKYTPPLNMDSLVIKSDSIIKLSIPKDTTFDSLLRVMARDSVLIRNSHR